MYLLITVSWLLSHTQFRTPHALNAETRGFLRAGPPTGIQWETYIYEYSESKPDGSTVNPHLILLSAQSCIGVDNTISLGELTTIVTAMRCRAYQPAVFDEDAVLVGDVEQSEDGNPKPDDERKLAFKDEKRFPVCYLSIFNAEIRTNRSYCWTRSSWFPSSAPSMPGLFMPAWTA